MKKDKPEARTHKKERPSSFKSWYEKNREEHNKKRRQRYAKDPKYRKKQLAGTKEWRAKQPPRARPKVEREGFSISEAAQEIGCSIETLRNFENMKLIPRVTPRGSSTHRRYSHGQVQLIAELVDYRKENHYKSLMYTRDVKKLVAKIKSMWGH